MTKFANARFGHGDSFQAPLVVKKRKSRKAKKAKRQAAEVAEAAAIDVVDVQKQPAPQAIQAAQEPFALIRAVPEKPVPVPAASLSVVPVSSSDRSQWEPVGSSCSIGCPCCALPVTFESIMGHPIIGPLIIFIAVLLFGFITYKLMLFFVG